MRWMPRTKEASALVGTSGQRAAPRAITCRAVSTGGVSITTRSLEPTSGAKARASRSVVEAPRAIRATSYAGDISQVHSPGHHVQIGPHSRQGRRDRLAGDQSGSKALTVVVGVTVEVAKVHRPVTSDVRSTPNGSSISAPAAVDR
jgi:hypothetical protein